MLGQEGFRRLLKSSELPECLQSVCRDLEASQDCGHGMALYACDCSKHAIFQWRDNVGSHQVALAVIGYVK